jgi:sterol desaturase/sphingolipid hydroxylase (fatty acid hydroxylase superfamily)
MHGIHHYAPADPDRLVFPPIPGILFVYIPLSTLVSYIITNPTAFHLYCASATIGYIMYDMIHFYLHHGKNFVGPFKYLKACHNHHHFFPNGEQHNYGISFAGKLVDFIMGTDHFPTKTVPSNSTA